MAAKSSAEDAQAALKSAEGLRTLNSIAMVAAAVGLGALGISGMGFLNSLAGRNEDIATKLRVETEDVQRSIEQHIEDVDRYGSKETEAQTSVPALRARIEQQRREIAALRARTEALTGRVDLLDREAALIRARRNRPAG